MKTAGGKLRELQEHWYRILKESGFKDIEEFVGGELVLKQECDHSGWYLDVFDREMRAEYFRVIAQYAFDLETVYRNEIDRTVLQLHADGKRIKEIVEYLAAKGMSRDRKSVRIIIRRYEMAWRIKYYTPKQLHRKTK